MYVVAVGLGGRAGMKGASTESERAPTVVGTPLKGPCETGRDASGRTGGPGAGVGNGVEADFV